MGTANEVDSVLVRFSYRVMLSSPTTGRFPMLVLSRKLGEKIVIGDNIVVTVVKIDRNQIRIGIEAPHEVPVYREEIAPVRGSSKTVAVANEPVSALNR